MNTCTGFVGVAFAASAVAVAIAAHPATTVYVGRHFEVRDHQQTVKYIHLGDTRVARVTGSISSPTRLQRLHLRTGWNLRSVAVDGGRLPAIPETLAVYQWNPDSRGYLPVAPEEPLDAGSVLWWKTSTNAVAEIVGRYTDPSPIPVHHGGSYIPGPGLETWSPQPPPGVTLWRFDSKTAHWQMQSGGELAPINELPPALAPGEALYADSPNPVELPSPNPALRIAYYHPDHLGSPAAVTDATGNLVEQAAYYPFGARRSIARFRDPVSPYDYSQKERDEETGLLDFGRRYLNPLLGAWLSPDPLGEASGSSHPYAYVNQNPLKHQDPDGAEITVTRVADRKSGVTTYQIHLKAVLIDASTKKFDQDKVAEFARKLESTIEKSYSGSQGKVKWNTQVDLRVIRNWSDVAQDEHVFRIVNSTRTDSAGSAKVGGKLMDIAASSVSAPTPDQVDRSLPANRHYTWEYYISPESTGAHEFGHSAGLSHDDTHPNLMQAGSVRKFDNRKIGLPQIQQIYNASEAGLLNQNEELLDDLTRAP